MSQSKIYVGNLPYDTSEEQLHAFFAQFAEPVEVRIIIDRITGRSKGFAFVSFEDQAGAQAALAADKKDFGGRALKVDLAREENGRSGGGRGGDRGGRGGDRGGRGGDRGGRGRGGFE